MIKLKVYWNQACISCGTELSIDYLEESPKYVSCPWCGADVRIDIHNDNPISRQKVAEAVRKLEEEINADFYKEQR